MDVQLFEENEEEEIEELDVYFARGFNDGRSRAVGEGKQEVRFSVKGERIGRDFMDSIRILMNFTVNNFSC